MSNVKVENVKIRHVTRFDIDGILTLHKTIGVKTSNISYMIHQNFGGPLDLSLVAEIDKKPVGFVLARLTYAYIPFVEVCLINGIMVDPHFRRRKIGHKLVDELLNHCRKEKVETIRALCDEENIELKKFIEDYGFHRSRISNWDKALESKP